MYFIDQQDNVIERTLIATRRHPDYAFPYPDLVVGLLDSDVPPNSISFAKVLPDDYREFVETGNALPSLRLNQEEEALIGWITKVDDVTPSRITSQFKYPLDVTQLQYSKALLPNDSGNPAFLILNNQLVLLTVWTGGGPGSGTSITHFKGDINQLITALDLQENITSGYQLTEINLNNFEMLNH